MSLYIAAQLPPKNISCYSAVVIHHPVQSPCSKKRRCEITVISFSCSICRGGLAALIGVTGKPYPSCLSFHSHPIRPCGAPFPRGEGCFYTSRHLDPSTQFSYFQISHFLTHDLFLRSGWRNAPHHPLWTLWTFWTLNPELHLSTKIGHETKKIRHKNWILVQDTVNLPTSSREPPDTLCQLQLE